MPIESAIDIESLLQPISEESPHGADIREDASATSSFYGIKDARNEGRSAERSAMLGDEVDAISPWQNVISTAENILQNEAKDIEVTCWMIEGLIRLYGLPGLRDGISLLDQLVEKYWDNLYPEPDEDGIETKVMPITGLNGESGEGTLMAPMRNAQLSDDYADHPFTFWEYQQAHAADQIKETDAKEERISSLGYSLKDITTSIANGDGAYFTDFLEALKETQTTYKSLMDKLRTHCGHDAPPSSNISNLLDELIRTCEFIYADKLVVEQPDAPAAEEAPAQNSGDSGAVGTQTVKTTTMMVREGAIVDREDALKRLSEIAEFFRRYEPHTPMAPGIERIIKWGRMTVSELMMELLPDAQSQGIYSQLTGVALDGSDSKAYVAPPTPQVSAAPAAAPDNNATAPAAAPASEPASSGGGGW